MTITTNNFTSKLNSIIKSAKTMRDNGQTLLEFGFTAYMAEGDTGYLTRTVAACVGVKSLNTAVMTSYIEHVANIKLNKAKDGTLSFKKATKGEQPTVKPTTIAWYDFEKSEAVVTELDVARVLASLCKRMDKASNDEKTINIEGCEAQLTELMARISGVKAS